MIQRESHATTLPAPRSKASLHRSFAMSGETLFPSQELAAKRRPPFPGESAYYRAARQALLAEEIEFRRHLTWLTAQRQALPPGPVIETDYRFQDENGAETALAGLFGDHDTLVT